MAKSKQDSGIHVVAKNKRARFDYELLDRYEAGLVLQGTEIKSIRAHKVSLQRAYVQARGDELYLIDANIAPYEHGNRENHEPKRPRKLLLHRREINNILAELQEKSLTAVPIRMYLKDGLAKLEFATARGKRKYDKRRDIAERDAQRQVDRALSRKYGR